MIMMATIAIITIYSKVRISMPDKWFEIVGISIDIFTSSMAFEHHGRKAVNKFRLHYQVRSSTKNYRRP